MAPVEPMTVAREAPTEIPPAAIDPGCAHQAAFVEPTTEPTVADVDKWWRCPDCGFRFQRGPDVGHSAIAATLKRILSNEVSAQLAVDAFCPATPEPPRWRRRRHREWERNERFRFFLRSTWLRMAGERPT